MSEHDCSIAIRKEQLRKQIGEKRSMLSLETRQHKSAIICSHAIAHLRLFYSQTMPHQCVLYSYMPIHAEVDTTPIMEWCWLNGIQVAIPRVIPVNNTMQFHFAKRSEKLTSQPPWGIREPQSSAAVADSSFQSSIYRNCMLIPGIAFDHEMRRVGYGGGYYDKYLQHIQLAGGIQPYKLALAYDLQMVAEVPCESHDFRVDGIITELGIRGGK